jgi:NAD(P)-dependent dehydrogenase (short-subunit alcohol dehydrogenase family)
MTAGALSGKVALVTGAGSGGIGRAICSRLAGHGAAIAAFDLDRAGLDTTLAELSGASLHLEAVDIAQAELLDQAVDRAVKSLGEIDILINCAGVVDKAKAIVDTSDEDWDRVFAVNVRAPFRLIRKVARSRRR